VPPPLSSIFLKIIGPLHNPVTWYKITYVGEQVVQWDLKNNATRASPPGPAFVLEVPVRNLLTSMCDFVPCDRIVQRAYYYRGYFSKGFPGLASVQNKVPFNLVKEIFLQL